MLLDIDDTERYSTLNNKRRLGEDPPTSDAEESSQEEDTGLTDNQNRLLYLLDLHTQKGDNIDNRWIRKQALTVLVYEGIIADVFDYDYAPHSTLIENRRIWANLSQEGQSDIEFLREEELIKALILSSKSYKPGVCYQISDKGKELVRHVCRRHEEAVDEFAHKKGTRELMKVEWDGDIYWLQSPSGYKQKSTITDTEDVSYVSSAYIPQCLRYGGRPTMSNAHKAYSSGTGATTNIRDQDLDEVITLNSVSIIVAEYIPFGSNQIVQLNNSVGCTERVQGGFITSQIDNDSTGTSIIMDHELTSVDILDYTLTNHINFEAEIHFAEDPGIVQIETFGVSLNAEGTCFYGMQIEAVMDKIKDKISLDHLARILVDVQQDSSKIVNSVISERQRKYIDLIFIGDALNRNKINLIIANEISPHLTAEEYMDKGEYENELKQIIGDTKAAYDISEKDTLIFGANGLLVCGPNARAHEPLLCAYLQFVTLDIFLQTFFARMWILNDDIEATNEMVDAICFDPTALQRVHHRICTLSKELIQMEEILTYVLEALQIMEIPPEPQEQAGRSLYRRLEISSQRSQLLRRSNDVRKNNESANRCLELLRGRVAVASDGNIAQLQEGLERNSKNLCTLQLSNVETVHLLRIMQIMFAGMIAFDVLDRITGDWTVLDTKWMKDFTETLMKDSVMTWFLISIGMWVLTAAIANKFFAFMKWRDQGLMTIGIQINRRIYIEKLLTLVRIEDKVHEERRYYSGKNVVNLTYKEQDPKEWGGVAPSIILEYDEQKRFLYQMSIKYNTRKAKKDQVLSAGELKEKMLQILDKHHIFDDSKCSSARPLAIEKRNSLMTSGWSGHTDK